MKEKIIVSLFSVIGIAVLSIVALANSSNETLAAKLTVCAMEITTGESLQVIPVPDTAEAVVVDESVAPEIFEGEDAYLLAKIAMAEAEDQDTKGKALVIRVVLNRAQDDTFPNSIKAVIYQPRQFSPITNGRFDRVEPDDDCWEALRMVEIDHWDESMGALYFESKSTSKWHRDNLKFLFQYGDHYFYTERE